MVSEYRPDIDGLRAVAVLTVVFFHAGFNFFSGGFVGVDIFFVISGFLITGIIQRNILADRFSILDFYNRRIRRIFPALFAVLIFVILFGYFFNFPGEYFNTAKTTIFTSIFLSNLFFATQHGYFTAPSEINPLLHTWSLGVEEQFYIFFPPLLLLLKKLNQKQLIVVLFLISVSSLVFAQLFLRNHPDTAFYITPTRIWELLLGSILAISPAVDISRKGNNFLSLVGFCLILISALFYSKDTPFPGITALLPCVGAALIIRYASPKGLVTRTLSTKAFVFVGRISYSLYLWHWPILVFYRDLKIAPFNALDYALYLSLAIFVSYLSWRFIENPFRFGFRKTFTAPRTVFAGAMASLLFCFIGFGITYDQGIPQRFGPQIGQILAVSHIKPSLNHCAVDGQAFGKLSRRCVLGDAQDRRNADFVLWGDSHGEALIPAFDQAARKLGQRGEYVGRGGCVPLLSVYQAAEGFYGCAPIANQIVHYVKAHHIQTVFIAARWALYADGTRYGTEKGSPVILESTEAKARSYNPKNNLHIFNKGLARTVKELTALGAKVFLIEDIPEIPWSLPEAMARAELTHQTFDFTISRSSYEARQQAVASSFDTLKGLPSVTLIPTYQAFCGSGKYCQIIEDGLPKYRDNNHMSVAASQQLADYFQGYLMKDGYRVGLER